MRGEGQFSFIQAVTREHRRKHRCGAYTFEDGPGLMSLVAAHAPLHALELGTALGYTACCLAAATDSCLVDTIEVDTEHVTLARGNIAQAGFADRVTVHQGDFAVVMKQLSGPYDLAFFDGFAPEPSLLKLLREKLREGGLLVCANLGFAEDASKAMLNDSARWKPAGSIEGGDTRAFVKNGAQK